MTNSSPHHCQPDPAGPPFAGLVAELDELGFEPRPVPEIPANLVYAATDSPVTVAVTSQPADPHVCVRATRAGQPWHVHWTAATPAHLQIAALYFAVNDDPAAALTAVAAALAATVTATDDERPVQPATPSARPNAEVRKPYSAG